jgi:fructokinase
MSKRWLTGIDLGGTKTEVILLDENHQEHFRHRVPTPAGDYQATLTNDANCLALSEATDGAGQNAGVVFAAILGTVFSLTHRL